MKEIEITKAEENIDCFIFAAVDIVNLKSYLFMRDNIERNIVKEAYQYKKIDDDLVETSYVSRKKDFIPPLSKLI